jgi:uncharacterized protein (TIRG00374 family)
MRAYDTAIQSKQTAKSVTSVFTDRLIGVFALALLSILALGVAWLSGEDISFYAIPVVIVFGICAIGILLIFDNRLMALLDGLLRRARLAKLADKVSKAYGPLYFLKDKRDVLLIAFVISIVLQINVVLFYYFIGVSLHLQVSLLFFFIIVPIALVVLLVPFTINGIGLREGVFVFLLTELGVSSQDAIALSLLSFALTLTQGITGGIIFALRGVRLRTGPAGSPVPPEPRGDA